MMATTLYDDHILQHSARQIRLLELDAEKHDEFGMTVCDLEHAPQFAAISYTWGEPLPTRTITVGQLPVQITSNAGYALEQVVPRAIGHGLQYIWIDSICIDQSSVADKSSQVALMGDIYAGAIKVFACIGQHADGSDDVFKAIRIRGSDLAQEVNLSSIRMISQRPYWTRVWIVQELFRATSPPIFLCGNDWASMVSLLSELMWGPMRTEEFADTPMSKVLRTCVSERRDGIPPWSSKSRRFRVLIEQLSDTKCADPRDHVFGLLSMVSWPDDLPGMVPDYGITLPQLVYGAIPYLAHRDFPSYKLIDIDRLRSLLRAFNIRHQLTFHQLIFKVIPYLAHRLMPSQKSIDVDLISLLLRLFKINRAGQLEGHVHGWTEMAEKASFQKKYRVPTRKALLIQDGQGASSVRLSPMSSSSGTCRLQGSTWNGISASHHYDALTIKLIRSHDYDDDDTQKSTAGSVHTCVGFTSASVEPGDWVVSIGNKTAWERGDHTKENWLVLRQSQSRERFDIIANAWLDPALPANITWPNAFFDLSLDGSDLMSLLVEQCELDHCAWAGATAPGVLNYGKPHAFALSKKGITSRALNHINHGYATEEGREVELLGLRGLKADDMGTRMIIMAS